MSRKVAFWLLKLSVWLANARIWLSHNGVLLLWVIFALVLTALVMSQTVTDAVYDWALN